ncbi:MAG: tetratricopeptide repeat protein [Pseudomonadota bacterium]
MTDDEIMEMAIAAHREGNREEAARLYTAILSKEPEHPDALHYLGLLVYQSGDSEEGAALIEKSLSIKPEQPSALNNLGNIYRLLGHDEDAMRAYWSTVKLDPGHANAWGNMAVIYRNHHQPETAQKTIRIALTFDPQSFSARHTLGLTLLDTEKYDDALQVFRDLIRDNPFKGGIARLYSGLLNHFGHPDEALSLLEEWREQEPDNPIAEHYVNAQKGINSTVASESYVRQTFDSFADTFEGVLKGLDYRTPDILAEKIDRIYGDDRLTDVIDLGCGTGLLGPHLKPRSDHLIGLDLSPNMMLRAKAKDVYDDLVEADIATYLDAGPEARYDLATAADVFVYIGDLGPVFDSVARSLRPGGRFLVTFEAWDKPAEEGYQLLHTGRFAHREDYVRNCAASAGFDAGQIDRIPLRKEFSDMIEGLVVELVKPA